MRIVIERDKPKPKTKPRQKSKTKPKTKSKAKSGTIILQRIDSFSKELIYINLILLIIAFVWCLYLCTKNVLDPQTIFSEVADCWKHTFPIYLCKSGVENISKAVTNTLVNKGGNTDECNSEWSCDDISDNGFSRAPEDNRDV